MTNGVQNALDIVKTALAVLPFLALCFLSLKINLKKPVRSRQFLMPVISLIYVIIIMISIDSFNEWLLSLLDRLVDWLNSLLAADWVTAIKGGSRMSELLNTVVTAIRNLIASLNMGYWIFYISNTVIILIYFVFKAICLGVLKKLFSKNSKLHDAVSGRFYEYFAERDVWCIKTPYVQTRSLFKAIYFTVAIFSSVIMIVSGRMYMSGLLMNVYYPVTGVLVIGELYFYLDGLTRREFTKDILGEDEDAYKTVNYSLLRKYLRNLFGDKLLTENTSVNNALAYNVTNDELLERLANDPDQAVVNFSLYYSNLNKSGFRLDHNYLFSSLDLLKGKSILFNNPFYRDLIPYAFYPMNRALLSGQKVLIVLGRHAIEGDIEQWVKDGIEAVTNIPFLWRIGVMDGSRQELDIGIVTRSKVLDIEMHDANEAFLKQVGFVVIIEPSKLVSTAQIGLNLLIRKCRGFDEKPIVYCMCDRNCDGIVDAMSHILMTSLTEVSATNKHLGTSSYMCWDADNEYLHHRLFPNVSRYMGFGTELSFAALKNQVSQTCWYGGEAFPVTDIRWIDRQYYYDLMKFASLPTSQDAVDEYFRTSPNMWSAQVSKNSYFTVEDESYNMFEVLRNFATRSTEQGFVNVISSDYLLKDYMASNDTIFAADAKAIPYLAADYARTHRNVILRLMLLMSISHVDEQSVRKEFSLIGLPMLSLREQLWHEIVKCLSSANVITSLPQDYADAVRATAEYTITSGDQLHEFGIEIVQESQKFDYEKGRMETVYSITDDRFIRGFVNELKSSSYVAEDEKGERYFLGAELSGHIYQRILPGQFLTFDGKYYEMRYLTSDNQVLLRRAADHIYGRPEYRQMREYVISAVRPSNRIGAVQDIEGIRIVKEFADISVSTDGYYRMDRYNDFKTAKKVVFEGENSRIPDRTYKNKKILRIELPDNDGAFTPQVRYTIALLMNETFKTFFADNQPYIAAVTDDSHIADDASCRPLTYSIRGEGIELPQNSIYIIEDSQIDIGLIIAVERNLRRILETVSDYLVWNRKAIARSLNPPPEEKPLQIRPEDIGEYHPPKKEGFFKRTWNKIKKFFRKLFGKDKEPEKPAGQEDDTFRPIEPDQSFTGFRNPGQEDTPTDTPPVPAPYRPEPPTAIPYEPEPEPVAEPEAPEQTPVPDDTDTATDDGSDTVDIPPQEPVNMAAEQEKMITADPDRRKKAPFDFTRLPYHQRYYLLYGFAAEPETIDSGAALRYLSQLGFCSNSLKDARNGRKIAKYVEATFSPNKSNARYCDFCGNEIFGVEYETLADGRDRCITCGRTAVKTEEEFRRIYEDVKRNLESFFGIKINTSIRVEMVNSQKLHRRLKKAFIPTPAQDGRVLGVAISGKHGYTLMIENGSPRISAMLTIAHELTHIWQYLNWNDKEILNQYGKDLHLEIYEGMAKWAEIQYAYLINEPSVAKREELITVHRNDEYGNGFIRYKANYPLSTGTVITHDTPFMYPRLPLDPMYCGDVSVMIDPNNGARGYDGDEIDDFDDFDDIDDFGDIPAAGGKKTDTYLRDPDRVPMYAYERLNDAEKELYDLMLDAVVSFAPTIENIPVWVSQQDVVKARDYILVDHPEIFWFNGNFSYTYEKESGNILSCSPAYCLTQQEAERRNAEIEAAVEEFLSGVGNSMSDYEVALAIYENVIRLVDYDSLELERASAKPSGNEPDDLRSIYGVFVNKKAVCAGYAKAVQYLFNRLGLECAFVSGEGKRGPHGWNLVKLSGEYYHLDVTWDDHSDTDKSQETSSEITYDYFCVTTKEILRDHTPDDTIPLPDCTSLACNYYYRNGFMLESYDFAAVRSLIRTKVAEGVCEIPLKADRKEVYNEMYHSLITEKKLDEIIRYLNLESATRVSASYSYSFSEEKLKLKIILKKI